METRWPSNAENVQKCAQKSDCFRYIVENSTTRKTSPLKLGHLVREAFRVK